MRRTLCSVLILLLAACGSGESSAPKATSAPAIPAKPAHYYVLKDGAEYGYEQAISSDDKSKGQSASKVLMFKYLGERSGELQFHARDGDIHSVIQCERPCEFVKQMVFVNERIVRKEHMRANEGSIIWALIQDAMTGQLKKFTKERNGSVQEVWFDEKNGPNWRKVVDAN